MQARKAELEATLAKAVSDQVTAVALAIKSTTVPHNVAMYLTLG